MLVSFLVFRSQEILNRYLTAGSFTGDYQSDYETEEVTETYAGTYEGDTLYGAGGELLGTPASIETYTLYVRID